MNWLTKLFKLKDLRNKILIILGLLALTRVLAHVPIPSLNVSNIRDFFSQSQVFGLLDIFSGGGLSNLSIAMLGVGPYITASIIVQLLTVIIPSWSELQKEGGEAGRAKLNKYTMYLTVPLTILQSYATLTLIARGGRSVGITAFPALSLFQWLVTILAITAGTMILVWIGELITNFHLGNGVSLIIFAGIVSRLPRDLQQLLSSYDPSQLTKLIAFAVIALVVIGGVVYTNEAQRNIPVSYAKRVRGDKLFGGVSTHLPLRLLQAGVIPIIFAISLLLFPPLIANFFIHAHTVWVANFAQWIVRVMQTTSITYSVIYFLLVVIFTYFYTALVFNPDEIAENVQKAGGFVPGLRPGRQTADYLYRILNRITTAGAIILGIIAVLPFLLQKAISAPGALTIGGTSLLIVVAVAVETMKQVEAQLVMREYEGL